MKRLIIRDGRIVAEPGLTCTTRGDRIHLHASTGRSTHPNDSFCEAPLQCGYLSTSAMMAAADDVTSSEEEREEYRRELEARKQPGYFHLAKAMREAIGKEWPQNNHSIFIATPHPALESELTELLLLEALAEEAEAGDPRAAAHRAHRGGVRRADRRGHRVAAQQGRDDAGRPEGAAASACGGRAEARGAREAAAEGEGGCAL
jgi:hypothetical protein